MPDGLLLAGEGVAGAVDGGALCAGRRSLVGGGGRTVGVTSEDGGGEGQRSNRKGRGSLQRAATAGPFLTAGGQRVFGGDSDGSCPGWGGIAT